MKRNLCKKTALCFCAAQMTFQGVLVSHGAWQTNGAQWQYIMENGRKMVRSSWHQEGNDWYWFDENGFMKTGWHLDTDGRWYFLNPVSDGTKGRMMTGWQWIDGHCYYLEEKAGGRYPLGAMYTGEKTPDGCEVNKNGAWIDDKGSPIHRPGKGIITKEESKNSSAALRSKNTSGQSAAGKSYQKSIQEYEGTKAEKTSKDHTGNKSVSPQEKIPDSEKADCSTGSDEPEEEIAQVKWQIFFTDSSVHQLQLAPSRSGTAEEGTDLTIYFQSKIVDAEKRIWKSLQKSPYIITVSGPSDKIIYMEYEQDGEAEGEADPWKEERESLEKCLKKAREQEAAFSGEEQNMILDTRFLAEDKDSCNIRLKSAASRIAPGESGIFYVIGKNYIPEGSVLAEVYGDDMEYSNTVEDKVTLENDIYILSRFQLWRKPADGKNEIIWSENEKRYWKTGDIQERTLDGTVYRFRCIDENYGGQDDCGKQKALFLCDTVIPADTGSSYIYEKMKDGTYGYRFEPGPVVSFGASDSYKYSNIRRWLKSIEGDFEDMEEISVGVSIAYSGITRPGSMKEMSGQGLKSSYIGSQFMMDRLFILSVDEAMKYAPWLWRFEGAEEENPESQLASFCKSYWLRTPYTGNGEEKVYVVDLIQGNIRPQSVIPIGDGDDAKNDVTGTTGVRPAFTVAQG